MGEAYPRAAVFTDSADFGRFCQIWGLLGGRNNILRTETETFQKI